MNALTIALATGRGEKWESGSEGVLRESEEEWREDRRPSRREAIRECIYNGELQQSGGRYEALINAGGLDDGLLRPVAEGGGRAVGGQVGVCL